MQQNLHEKECHCWFASLEVDDKALHTLKQSLSKDELARAARFVFDKDSRRFIAARGYLRHLLSRYLNLPADAIAFDYGEHGKPMLAVAHDESLFFNVSHTRDIAVFVVAKERDIGVDVEALDKSVDIIGLAKRFFSSDESARLLALPQAQQQDAFFACWTRKEAFVKAIGQGLTFPLARFDMTFEPDEPAALLAVRDVEINAKDWRVFTFLPKQGFPAAVVCPVCIDSVKCFSLDDA